MHVLVVFGNGGGLLLCPFTRLRVNVRVCNLHNPHHTGHIENYKQHTAGLHIGGFVFFFTFSSRLIFRLTNIGWMAMCTFRLRCDNKGDRPARLPDTCNSQLELSSHEYIF